MIVSDFVPKVFLEATGKINTFATGSAKWLKILALANVKIDDWMDEPNIDWNSLYSPDYSLGTVTATAAFTYPAAVRKLGQQEGNVVRILHTDGSAFTDYSIVGAERQKEYANGQRTYQNNYVIETGATLRFNRAFATTDPQFGGTIYAPVFLFASHISADADVIPVDIPNWLVYATAADYVSYDVTRQNLTPRLEAKANEIMANMKSNNGGQVTRIYQPFRPFAENWVDEAWTS